MCEIDSKPNIIKQEFTVKNPKYTSPEFFNCELSPLEKYFCRDCAFKTDLIMTLKQHIEEAHIAKLELNSPLILLDIRNSKCGKCDFETYSSLHWFKHKQYGCTKATAPHRDINRFKCILCSWTTEKRKYIKSHFKLKHMPDELAKRFECSYCQFKTKQKVILERHVIRKHTALDAINWVHCDQCSYKSKCKSNLSEHKKYIHSSADAIKWFECDKCSYKAKWRGNLQKHLAGKHRMKRGGVARTFEGGVGD